MERLNSMCEGCKKLHAGCDGTVNKTWTGCVHREVEERDLFGKPFIERVMERYPNWPRRIRHGEYIGVISGVQPLLGGDAAPLYRFPGGECVGDPADIVRTAPVEDAGELFCGRGGALLACSVTGDMPELCPVCHEGIDWSAWEEV